MKFGTSALIKIEGRSLPLNILMILINLTGLVMLVCAYHASFAENTWLKPAAYSVFGLGLVGLFVLRGFYLLSYVSRAFVGGLFIVSGLVKANDPLGFSYKLEEYFEDGALAYRVRDLLGWESFSLEWLIQYALALSIVICVVEIVLGIMIIINAKIKLAAWLLLGMMLFFTALTFHTSECNASDTFVNKMTFAATSPQALDYIEKAKSRDDLKILLKTNEQVVVAETKNVQCVSDCGCFGDALKGSVGRSLTPKESYWKDLILDYFVLIIFILQWRFKPNSTRETIGLSLAAMTVVIFFSWVFHWFFPVGFAIVALLLSLWARQRKLRFVDTGWASVLMSSVLCSLVVLYVMLYLPLKDYRPYAVGSNIYAKMHDGIESKIENTFVYKNVKTGAHKSMSQAEYNASKIWENKAWKFDTILPKVLVEGKLPSITEQFNPYFSISSLTQKDKESDIVKSLLASSQTEVVIAKNNSYGISDTMLKADFHPEEYDSTYVISYATVINPELSELYALDYILKAPAIFIVSVVSIEDANWSNIGELKEIAAKAKQNNIPFILICGSGNDIVQAFKRKYKWDIPILTNDRTELKAVCRSNPGLLILKKGVVAEKYPHRALPSFETIQKNVLKKN